MVRFGMNNTLVTFKGKYYKIGANNSPWEKGLTIGGYESAWFADLVASFILETRTAFFKETKYYGIYRDDGLVIFNEKKNQDQIKGWLDSFLAHINSILDFNALQFTANIWAFNGYLRSEQVEKTKKLSKVSQNTEPFFPFLDLQLEWDTNKDLCTNVHLKENQQLKYLNADICHTKACLIAVPHGVLNRLAKLTSPTPINIERKLDMLYPEHAIALWNTKIAPKEFPTLVDVLQQQLNAANKVKCREAESVW